MIANPTDSDLIASYLREFEEMQQAVSEHPGPYFNVMERENEAMQFPG